MPESSYVILHDKILSSDVSLVEWCPTMDLLAIATSENIILSKYNNYLFFCSFILLFICVIVNMFVVLLFFFFFNIGKIFGYIDF